MVHTFSLSLSLYCISFTYIVLCLIFFSLVLRCIKTRWGKWWSICFEDINETKAYKYHRFSKGDVQGNINSNLDWKYSLMWDMRLLIMMSIDMKFIFNMVRCSFESSYGVTIFKRKYQAGINGVIRYLHIYIHVFFTE